MTELLPKEHRILERPFMEYRPFGVDVQGRKIQDASGAKIVAYVEYLEEAVGRAKGPDARAKAVDELAELLNQRIRDPAYHVTPTLLKNAWNSYSYEFLCYLGEFCKDISGDPEFPFKVGKEKLISPVVQTLGRPFSLMQIFKMFPHFGEKFAKGSLLFEVKSVSEGSAVLRMKCTDEVYRQLGAYRYACTEMICQSSKGGLVAVPERVHRQQPARIEDLSCMSQGDEYCEWRLTWIPQRTGHVLWPIAIGTAGASAFAYLHLRWSGGPLESLGVSLLIAAALWAASRFKRFDTRKQEALIDEQLRFMEARHEELREAYLEQQRTTVELRRKIGQLTTLHHAGLIFSSTFDRETLLKRVLEAIIHDLHYDRAMIALYDHERRVLHHLRIIGVSEEITALTEGLEVPVNDPESFEARVLRHGEPIVVGDIREAWDHLHPFNRLLAEATRATALISVPLKVKDRVLGCLTVDRTKEHSLLQEDLDLMVTLAAQVAIALDNAEAYHQIEELNVGLGVKVQERTAELERLNRDLAVANDKLRELDRAKSGFVSMVSHELRTPMTSIKGYVENLLDGLVGSLTERQVYYLTRVKHNIERLTRMIYDLLDLSRIEAGAVVVKFAPLSVPDLMTDVVESFQGMTAEKGITLIAEPDAALPVIQGDRDKLQQILINLIQNAIKFTPRDGRIVVEGRLCEPEAVLLCVADTGCGIPADELPRIFDRFYSGDSIPGEARGAGLGLAITKSLVELHGGRIWVESVPCEGSRFYFTLPIRQAAPVEGLQRNPA